jgi:aminoglycoside phosphotransferase (APT) family kinase protein
VLVHGDVGPAHILLLDGVVSGIIDWSDAHIGDPAMLGNADVRVVFR